MIVVLVAFMLALAIGVALRQRVTTGAAIVGILAIVALAPAPQNQIIDLNTTVQETP